jgi:hypothetical protein
MLLDLEPKKYIEWKVKTVMKLRGRYAFRVILTFSDETTTTQQKS